MFPEAERFDPPTVSAYAPTWRDQSGGYASAECEIVAKANCSGLGEKEEFDFVILNFRGDNYSLHVQSGVLMNAGDRLHSKRTDTGNVLVEIVFSHGPGKPVAYQLDLKLPNGDRHILWARTSVAYEYDSQLRTWTLLRYDSHPIEEVARSTAT